MRRGAHNIRFVVLAAVCLVVAAAGVAWTAPGDPVLQGRANDAKEAPTSITASPSVAPAFQVTATGTGTGPAIKGVAQNNGSGVYGSTNKAAKFGVTAVNNSTTHGAGAALLAQGGQNAGVVATSAWNAVQGTASGTGSGVLGTSSGGGTGVYGSTDSASNAAVFGTNTSGDGMHGISNNASHSGVYGQNISTGGWGVYGASKGVGVFGLGGPYGVSGQGTLAGVTGNGPTGILGSGTTGVEGRGSGDGVRGITTGGGSSGLFGQSTGGGYGVYGITSGANNAAVFATNDKGDGLNATSGDVNHSGIFAYNTGGGWGVYASTTSSTRPAIYASNPYGDAIEVNAGNDGLVADVSGDGHAVSATAHTLGSAGLIASGGVGVLAETNVSGGNGLVVQGPSYFGGDAHFSGSKSGYVADYAVNASSATLHRGDAVSIKGYRAPILGEIPLIVIGPAGPGEHVIGVVDRKIDYSAPVGPPNPTNFQSWLPKYIPAGTTVNPDDYLLVVTLGSFQTATVDASAGPIHAGDSLSPTATPGVLGLQPTLEIQGWKFPIAGTAVGYALGEITTGRGHIPVFVNAH